MKRERDHCISCSTTTIPSHYLTIFKKIFTFIMKRERDHCISCSTTIPSHYLTTFKKIFTFIMKRERDHCISCSTTSIPSHYLTIFKKIFTFIMKRERERKEIIPVPLIKFSSMLQRKWFQLFHLNKKYINNNKLKSHEKNMGSFNPYLYVFFFFFCLFIYLFIYFV